MKAAEHTRLMTEGELQSAVTDMLTLYGWKWHHETDSTKSKAGVPDLIAVHPSGWFLLIELKGYDKRGRLGKVTDYQKRWLSTWRHAGAAIDAYRIAAHIWHPSDLRSGEIRRCLEVARDARCTITHPEHPSA